MKPGTKVKCLDNGMFQDLLKEGGIYTVESEEHGLVTLKELRYPWTFHHDRFEEVDAK